MKLVTFEVAGRQGIGVLDGDHVLDLGPTAPALPTDLVDLIALGAAGLTQVATAAAGARALRLDEVRLLSPIPRPRRDVMAVGRNYRDHAVEFSNSGFDASEVEVVPDAPVIFGKPPTSVIGPGDAIDTGNDPTNTTDYEGELAVVIGSEARRVAPADAMEHVYGYTIVNDVTARQLQKRHVQWYLGKGPDSYCPMGPAIVTADELPDVSDVWLRTWVNGELRQESRITLVFDIATLISTISNVMRLEPGDVIATGTPVGTGMGFDPPVYLTSGDVVKVAIDGIGILENPVV